MDKKFKIKALDGLRGIAALIVILSHTSNVGFFFIPYMDFSGIGKSGVYLFFILSSFLLTLPLLYKGKGIFTRQHMLQYWSRRFLRVYPFYILYLLAAFISSIIINNIWGPKSWAIPFQLTINEFIEHIVLMAGKSVTWSIAVEFKYYFVLPLIAYVLSTFLKCALIKSVVFLSSLILVFLYIYPSQDFISLSVGLGQYIPVFLFGALLATVQYSIYEKDLNLSKYYLYINLLGYICLFLLVLTIPSIYSFFITHVEANYFSKSRLMYSFIWTLFIFCIVNGNSKLTKLLSNNFICFWGKISFSAYLIHPVIIDLMRHFKLITPVNAWIVILLTLFLSYITYRFIEAPGMKFSSNIRLDK